MTQQPTQSTDDPLGVLIAKEHLMDPVLFPDDASFWFETLPMPGRATEAEGGEAHCQASAQRLASGRIYDWLDDTFAVGGHRDWISA